MRHATRLLPVLLLVAALAAPATLTAPAAAEGYTVVGGEAAQPGAWPSVVALVRAAEPDDVVGQFCAGTAVAADLVLTAAHCFHSATGDVTRGPDQVRVVAGRTDLSADGGVEVVGTAVYVHPSYDARRKRHDVAVLRVAGDLGVPVQGLAGAEGPVPAPGQAAVVVGWGRTGPDEEAASRHTSQLQQAEVAVSADERCATAYEGTLDPHIHLCAGGDGSEAAPAADACTGDSGGPLLLPDPDGGPAVQVGITSFGPTPCGIGEPGVFTRVAGVAGFVDQVVAGQVAPTILPGDAAATPRGTVRVAAEGPTSPISQAVAASRAVFDAGRAELAVLARADGFADALAGSALGYGRGPLLFTPSTGSLAEATREELRRAVQPGSTIYLLGGASAVPEEVAHELAGLGFTVHRLAGDTREATAAAVAAEVVARHGAGQLPADTAVLATAHAWPDAVLAGQLGAWWGFPVLLTPADRLHPATAEVLQQLEVGRLLVVGGEGAVGQGVLAEVAALLPGATIERLAGSNRIETGVALAGWHVAELAAWGERPPDAVVAVNVRREDAYAHVLSATPILGATAGVLLPVEGEAGDVLAEVVVQAFCGIGGLPLVAGGTDLVAESVADRLGGIVDGTAC